jgi:hypothetical protein
MAHADERPAAAAPTSAALTTWAMRWITEAVARMAHDLNAYGAAPLRAEIVKTTKEGDQTFAIVQFVFPRGDATSLMFGFDTSGKVTGVALGGLVGD